MGKFTKSYTDYLKGKGEGFTLYFHSIGECRFIKGDMLKVFEYIFNLCNMTGSRKIRLNKPEKRELIYITGQKLGNIRDRVIYPLENLGLIKFYRGEWCIELASSPSLRHNPYLILTKLERQIFKFYSTKPGISDIKLLCFRDSIKRNLSLKDVNSTVQNLMKCANSDETREILGLYSNNLINLGKSIGIEIKVSKEWLDLIIKSILPTEKELNSLIVIGDSYLRKEISDWDISNFSEYFIAQYQQVIGKTYVGPMDALYNHLEFVYEWNEGKINHNQIVKDYIDLFFKRCTVNPNLTPTPALLGNRKNCEILDSMYEVRLNSKKRKYVEHLYSL
ncbi:hypothetical protein ABE039_20770 [Priestia megaterium]